MKKGVPITRIMTKNLITLSLEDDLATAERLFKKHRIRHIPVTSGAQIRGMLSYTDLMRISFADALHENEIDDSVYDMFTIEQIMANNVISVTSQNTVREVAEQLAKKEFHALPVVDDGILSGIVTTTDLINYFLENC
ncbi:CBS domain-containing protein [Pricia sp. S334]|uniref:CBS domain-containing protein n=1 Tax=Pricia mediterranea TaxID=3076079 RepID=A0ABU3L2B8_9FLAO|nr:CBS domain-containing protein [Pricia sp. S334]MDT7827408.1 CBS domain-containing protein [Pricia sp. S334]